MRRRTGEEREEARCSKERGNHRGENSDRQRETNCMENQNIRHKDTESRAMTRFLAFGQNETFEDKTLIDIFNHFLAFFGPKCSVKI